MKIAVTSRNGRDITEHAGRCRRFWVFEIDDGVAVGRDLVEISSSATLHESDSEERSKALAGVRILISGGMGDGLRARLARQGVTALVTSETVPERAVEAWLGGCLPLAEPHGHGHATGDADESEGHCGRGCACHG